MRKEVPQEAPWDAPHATQWDGETVASWMRRNLRTSKARTLMRVMIEAGMAASPSEISLLHLLNYANGTGGFKAMTQVTGGTLENRFDGGSHRVVMTLAESVAAETYTGAVVRRISQRGDYVTVTGAGFTATARRVVVAVPVPLAGRIDFDPVLPAYRDKLTQRLTMGSAIKYLVLYDEPFWRADGLTGMATSPNGPVRATIDSCPPDGTPGVLTAFVTGPAAREVGRLTAAERRELVLRELVRFFGPRAARPYELIEQNWLAEEFTRGCYHGYAPPGLYTEYGQALTEPVGRIHWAGAESVPVEYGSMSGAIHSGLRVAKEIVALDAGHPSDTQIGRGHVPVGTHR
jgi:monoamine oxidase